MLRRACFVTALFASGTAQEAKGDSEADETCALQVQKGSVNCGGHFRPTCQACPSGNGPSWCNGECQWDYNDNTCKQKACCKAYTADCLSCEAGVSKEVYCSQNQHRDIPGCPNQPKPCCMANNAECLACAAGVSEEVYCQQNQGQNIPGCPREPPTPQKLCALCETCGGTYPEVGGRITYFRDEKTEWSSYGEHCSGQERTRTPDNVIFSPNLCCTPSYGPYAASFLQVEQKEQESNEEVRALSELEATSESSSSIGGNGWCRLCDQCGGGYDFNAGEITQLAYAPSNSDGNSQNYERHEGQCLNSGGTRGAPPAAKLCCQTPPSSYSSACSICQSSCGGGYPSDGGALSYTTNGKSVKFIGYAGGCSSSKRPRVSYGAQDAARLCCAR